MQAHTHSHTHTNTHTHTQTHTRIHTHIHTHTHTHARTHTHTNVSEPSTHVCLTVYKKSSLFKKKICTPRIATRKCTSGLQKKNSQKKRGTDSVRGYSYSQVSRLGGKVSKVSSTYSVLRQAFSSLSLLPPAATRRARPQCVCLCMCV